jgi:2-dehydro-3-deoxyglucarate aldolase/4-hydroxy-2-oxoheptanedioate aldolase
MDRCEELLSIPGTDVGLVGPADLSISLGIPGEFENPALLETVERFQRACEKTGVAPGIQVRTLELGRKWIQRGMRFVGCGSDHFLLFERAREIASELRGAAEAR